MPRYEYRVVPAPKKAGKVKGVKTTEGRFAHELAQVMNQYGAEGWEYQRTDTLPCEERSGLTGKTTVFQNMLVFRRELEAADGPTADAIATIHATAPAPMPEAVPESIPETMPEPVRAAPEAAADPVFARSAPQPEPAPQPKPMFSRPMPQPAPQAQSQAQSQVPSQQQPDDPAPERHEANTPEAAPPTFHTVSHAPQGAEDPAFSTRMPEGRTPRLGAARHPEPSGKTPGFAAR